MMTVEKWFVHADYASASTVQPYWWRTEAEAQQESDKFAEDPDVLRTWIERDDVQERH